MGSVDQPFRFSSKALDAEDGFGRYHDLYPVASNVTATGQGFHAEAHAHRLSRMIVVDRMISGVSHVREARHARQDGFDHVVVQMVTSGQWTGGPPGEERLVSPGEIILLDMARPQRNWANLAQLITINLPRDLIEATLRVTPAMHGVVLPASTSHLLGEFMLMLKRLGADSPAAIADSAAQALIELTAGAFANYGGHLIKHGDTGAGSLRRERAELFIDARLADDQLDAAYVAHSLGVSRTVLYQLFQSSGGVARYILGRRLERLARALRRSTETRSISQLAFAFGFASESHCSKAFRSAYGMPPGQYRKDAAHQRAAANDVSGLIDSALDIWHSALR
ncbi:Transcriptional activator FeaR [Devosia equisanguinis]|uniref:Transcriptional activator FeaR n=1 Tax=Devosia equisanguinis TaxID=2490941 RepID=A0A3S4CT13_9HYPH|nr:helix-turn-helix domain-containing protein [Devosia equisanguinis]VDS05219.1 Transcriptional activator FeaR [Devosia equisanguinis]